VFASGQGQPVAAVIGDAWAEARTLALTPFQVAASKGNPADSPLVAAPAVGSHPCPVGTSPQCQPGVLLPQEEVTPVGVQVIRGWRYARWIDGRQLSWVGRPARPRRGPGAGQAQWAQLRPRPIAAVAIADAEPDLPTVTYSPKRGAPRR
jgi:hypothetical protein